jgi:hypothetical protein
MRNKPLVLKLLHLGGSPKHLDWRRSLAQGHPRTLYESNIGVRFEDMQILCKSLFCSLQSTCHERVWDTALWCGKHLKEKEPFVSAFQSANLPTSTNSLSRAASSWSKARETSVNHGKKAGSHYMCIMFLCSDTATYRETWPSAWEFLQKLLMESCWVACPLALLSHLKQKDLHDYVLCFAVHWQRLRPCSISIRACQV